MFETHKMMDWPIQRKRFGQRGEMKELNSSVDKQVEIHTLISGCKKKDRESYKLLYQHFYSYAMSVCVRYSGDIEEAKEVLNDGFMNAFIKIDLYDSSKPFEDWLRGIMINTAVERYRKNQKCNNNGEIEKTQGLFKEGCTLESLSYYEILKLTQQLSPMYRIVFSMQVIDGYTYKEIAKKLNTSVDVCKSNLFKARTNLKKMVG